MDGREILSGNAGRIPPLTFVGARMDILRAVAQVKAARRILLLGSSGSGKTTLALQLGGLLELPVIHLDAHFWQPGWVPTPPAAWRERVAQLVAGDAWIMDGTYERSLDLRIPAADCLIVLDRSRWICLWRIVKRKWTVDDRRRPDAPAGQRLDLAFFRYVWQYPTVTIPWVNELVQRHGPDKPRIDLSGERGMQQFLKCCAESCRPADLRDRPSGTCGFDD